MTDASAAARDVRVQRLRQARAADSKAKTLRGLEAVASLVAAGERVTVTRVARKAAVSTWFVYNRPEVHQAVQAAIREQARHGIPAAAVVPRQRVSEASLQTDLALAREEIKDLKTERDRLQERVRLALGAEIEQVQQPELLRRTRGLERHNALLVAELAEQTTRADKLERRTIELEDEVTAVRRALTRSIRAVPPPPRC
ncbi:DUF6262 family protein [Streptomyces sp. NBS 14/10]|uniref:DUF6262 family protein n=1 Tax=Streptomyces sp. NBS 14/10 TaxID=1945643 RepID=UPI000B9CF687|nr:DUF6262 family protein [Streptomyces sp. NBS 14/10]KAK1177977.1 DUF6262 family protein [Streptomyces sp. NBS 14/10]